MINKLKIILPSILIIIVTFVIFYSKNFSLNLLKNTDLSDIESIKKILKKLEYGEEDFSFKTLNKTLIVDYDIELYNYKTFEKNASYLFYLINDLENIVFNIDETKYSFNYNNISLIYNGFKKTKISDIEKRYNNKNFNNVYLGNINGNIDLFDSSDLCIEEYKEFYEDDNYKYYITCSSLDDVIVVIDNESYKLVDALNDKKFSIDDLFKINVKLKKEVKNNENSN